MEETENNSEIVESLEEIEAPLNNVVNLDILIEKAKAILVFGIIDPPADDKLKSVIMYNLKGELTFADYSSIWNILIEKMQLKIRDFLHTDVTGYKQLENSWRKLDDGGVVRAMVKDLSCSFTEYSEFESLLTMLKNKE